MPAQHLSNAYSAEVWPENWTAWTTFLSLSTQWRTGPSGVIGLDYNVLEHMLQQHDCKLRQQIRNDIRVLEAAALTVIYANNDER